MRAGSSELAAAFEAAARRRRAGPRSPARRRGGRAASCRATRPRIGCREPRRARRQSRIRSVRRARRSRRRRGARAGRRGRRSARCARRTAAARRARGWSSCARPREQLRRAEPECLLRHVVEAVPREHRARAPRAAGGTRSTRGGMRTPGDRRRVRRRTARPCGTTTRAGRAPAATPVRRRPGARRVRRGRSTRAHSAKNGSRPVKLRSAKPEIEAVDRAGRERQPQRVAAHERRGNRCAREHPRGEVDADRAAGRRWPSSRHRSPVPHATSSTTEPGASSSSRTAVRRQPTSMRNVSRRLSRS